MEIATLCIATTGLCISAILLLVMILIERSLENRVNTLENIVILMTKRINQLNNDQKEPDLDTELQGIHPNLSETGNPIEGHID